MDWLKEKGLFRGTAGNAMRLGLCSRSGDVIEPVLKPQWWVDMKDMAAEAIAAAKDKRLTIIPSEFEATWFRQVLSISATLAAANRIAIVWKQTSKPAYNALGMKSARSHGLWHFRPEQAACSLTPGGDSG